MILAFYLLFEKTKCNGKMYHKSLKLNRWNHTNLSVNRWVFCVTKEAGSHEMNIRMTDRPSQLELFAFFECEHCFTKVRKCFHSECNFFLCYLIWNIMGHLREKIEHVEILKFDRILDMCKKISCWYLFWISKFKFWWDLLILIGLKHFQALSVL